VTEYAAIYLRGLRWNAASK